MGKITNTQYLKKGMHTNVGIVKSIQDNAWFTTTDGFSHSVNEEVIVMGSIIGKICTDTWNDSRVAITEKTGESNYYKFENDSYSSYGYLGERFQLI